MLRLFRAARDGLRTLFGLIVVVLLTVVLGVYVIVLASFRPTSPQIRPLMRFWAFVLMKLAGVSWEIEGKERLVRGRSYVFVGNHLSNLDPPFHIATLSEFASVRFLAKQELFRIPVFAQAMRRIGIVETDRAAHAAAHRKINRQVRVVVERGQSLVIYPEGTRSRDAELKPFKKGAFRIAVDNGMAVVPIATSGLERAWPPDTKLVRGGRARMVIHDPIDTSGMGHDDIEGLRNRVRATIAETYEKIRQ